MNRIGFVILTWNSERVIGKCLRSILELKQVECRVILVDNGSTDQTRAIIDSYVKKSGNFIIRSAFECPTS